MLKFIFNFYLNRKKLDDGEQLVDFLLFFGDDVLFIMKFCKGY